MFLQFIAYIVYLLVFCCRLVYVTYFYIYAFSGHFYPSRTSSDSSKSEQHSKHAMTRYLLDQILLLQTSNFYPFSHILCQLHFFLQSSVSASVRLLQTSMEAVAGQENVEIETEGYLLEKGVKETFMEYVDPVLKLLLLNQVNPSEAKPEEGLTGTTTTS